jgi:hypothetical protein
MTLVSFEDRTHTSLLRRHVHTFWNVLMKRTYGCNMTHEGIHRVVVNLSTEAETQLLPFVSKALFLSGNRSKKVFERLQDMPRSSWGIPKETSLERKLKTRERNITISAIYKRKPAMCSYKLDSQHHTYPA